MKKTALILTLFTAMALSSCGASKPAAKFTVTGNDHSEIAYKQASYHVDDEVKFNVNMTDEHYGVDLVRANDALIVPEGDLYSFKAIEDNTIQIVEKSLAVPITTSGTHATITLEHEVYKEGELVNFKVVADTSYVIESVKANNVLLTPSTGEYPYSFTASSNNNITAVAKGVEVSITTVKSEYPVVTFERDGYLFNDIVRFKVTYPDTCGFQLDKVYVNEVELTKGTGEYPFSFTAELENEITITDKEREIFPSDMDIRAEHCTYSFDKESYKVGATANMTVNPDRYYKVKKVEINGSEVTGVNNVYSFTVQQENTIVITPDFAPEAPTLIAKLNGNVTTNYTYTTLNNNADEVKLPIVEAIDCYGSPLNVTISSYTFNGEEATDPGYITNAPWTEGDYKVGTHIWVFTAIDTHDASVKADLPITLNVYQKITDYWLDGNLSVTDERTPDAKITSTNADFSLTTLYMNNSKNYYVEAVFDNFDAMTGNIGFFHTDFVKGGSYSTTTNVSYMQNIDLASKQFKIGSLVNNSWQDTVGVWTSFDVLKSGIDGSTAEAQAFAYDVTTPIKLASARIGDNYFLFMNDFLLEADNFPELKGKDTLMGLMFKKPLTSGVRAHKFVFLEEESAAVNKVNALLEKSSMFHGARTDSYWKTECNFIKSGSDKGYAMEYTTSCGEFWHASSMPRYLINTKGSKISFDAKFIAQGSDGWWGAGMLLSTYFVQPNFPAGDYTTNANVCINGMDIEYRGNTFNHAGYGNSTGAQFASSTTFDETSWKAIFTKTTDYHIEIEIRGSEFKYTVSDNANPANKLTGTSTTTYADYANCPYVHQIFTSFKTSLSIYHYQVTCLDLN